MKILLCLLGQLLWVTYKHKQITTVMLKSKFKGGSSGQPDPQPQPQPQPAGRPTGPTRLRQLWVAPTLDEIRAMLATAKKQEGRPVEQPFSVQGQDALYQIKVLATDYGDPEWTFSSGTLTGLKVVWVLPSIDVQLIHSLVVGESTGEEATNLIGANDSGRLGGGSINLPSHNEEPEQPSPLAGAGTAPGTAPGTASAAQPAQAPITTAPTPAQAPPTAAPPAAAPALPAPAPTAAAQAQAPAVSSEPQASLEGDLEKLNLPAVLQSLLMSKMTGRLTVSGQQGSGSIFLVDGQPIHATTGDARGDHAVLEMLLWSTGKFSFFANDRCPEYTLTKRLETLLMEGLTLVDQNNYLNSSGIILDSCLGQCYKNLSEQQFEQLVMRGAPADMHQLKDFYMEVDGKTSLYEILRRLALPKAAWVPVLFNLLQVGLVRIVAQAEPERSPESRIDRSIDQKAINLAMQSLQRVETETFTYPVFQYFVQQELARYALDANAFSVVVFDMMVDRPGGREHVMPNAAKFPLERIKALKRDIDTIGHVETFDFGLILPQTAPRSAVIVAQRIAERVNSSPLEGFEGLSISMTFGIAACPQDGKTAGAILGAAIEAKKYARQNNLLVVEFKAMT